MKKTMANHKQTRKNTIKRDSSLEKTFKSSFLGILITVGIGFSLMLASTAAAILTDDPTAFVAPIGYVLPFLCAFIGGFICSKLNKASPYLTSALCGVGFFLISMLCSFIMPSTMSSEMNVWLRLFLHLATLSTFPLGAFASIKSSKPQHIKNKRR